MTIRNGKVEDKKLKSSWNEHLKFLSKYFVENGKEKFFSNDFSFANNLKNDKTNTAMTI